MTVAFSAGTRSGLTPEHIQDRPRLGESFIVVLLLGIAIAIGLIVRPDSRRLAAMGGLFCLAQMLAWTLFVTMHVPFVPGTPESVENIAVVSKIVEAVGIGLAAGLVRARETPRAGRLRVPTPRAAIAHDARMNFRAAVPMVLAALFATGVVVVTAGGRSASDVAGNTSAGDGTQGITASSITFGSYGPLNGDAAPGYSEVAAASRAYFDYVNSYGGVFGRKIKVVYRNAADPAVTAHAARQLVQQDHVFAMFEGVATPTPTNAVSYLNAAQVPDLFVGSSCPCWDNGSAQPFTFGWQPSSTIEGKILGQYIKQYFPGQQLGVLFQDDDFGRGGLAGITDEVPGADIAAKQAYRPGVTTLAPQITALKAAGAQVLVDFTAPSYTAMGQLASIRLGYKPQLVVSNVGNDPTTVAARLRTISNGTVPGATLLDGAITDGYLPSPTARANPWIRLFTRIHDRYDARTPFDSNVVYGMANAYTVVEALMAAGKDLTRQKLVDAIDAAGANWKGPGLVPFRYSVVVHGGFSGVQMGRIRDGKIALFGNPLRTDPSPKSPIRSYSTLTPPPPPRGIPMGTQISNGYQVGPMKMTESRRTR